MEKVLLIIIGDKKSNSYLNLNICEEVLPSEMISGEDIVIKKIDNYIVDLVFADRCVSQINEAISKSELNYFCILPQNVFLSKNWLSSLISAHKTTNLNCGALGILSSFADKEFSSVFCNQNDDFPVDVIISKCINGVILFDRYAIECIGYFEQSIMYLENFCIRLSLFGLTNFYLSNETSIVFKEEASQSGIDFIEESLKTKNLYLSF